MRILDRFGAGPVDLLRRVLFKTIVGPIKYRSSKGYDADRFWRDRFAKYGISLRGSGDEGLSEERNRRAYQEAASIVVALTSQLVDNVSAARVLDVGCGPGFYTQVIAELGVKSYTGIDITDTLFPLLVERFPDYSFVRKDITSDQLDGQFDLVLIIDVVEHIVVDDALEAAIGNVKDVVAPGGILLVGPLMEESRRHLFYVRFWSMDEFAAHLAELPVVASVPFRNGYLMAFRRSDE